jgi:hypothetical protein
MWYEAQRKSPSIPLFQRGKSYKKDFTPLFDKEGQGEIYSANFGDTTLAALDSILGLTPPLSCLEVLGGVENSHGKGCAVQPALASHARFHRF